MVSIQLILRLWQPSWYLEHSTGLNIRQRTQISLVSNKAKKLIKLIFTGHMSDYTPPFNVNVDLLTFNLVQREQEVTSIVTALEVDRHGPLYTMGSGVFH